MKKYFIFLLVLFFAEVTIPGQLDAVGIGFIIGAPTGLSLSLGRFPVMGFSWSFHRNFIFAIDG